MQTTTAKSGMRTVTISFSQEDRRAAKFVEALKLVDFLTIEESPYDPQYVAEIKAMDKRTFKAVKTADLWK